MNKITQLINEITHRTKKADNETSACQENNVVTTAKKSKSKISLSHKHLRWCLLGMILLIGGYCWWRIPAKLKIIAMIPGDNINEISHWNHIGLCQWNWSKKNGTSSIVTQYGWDGKPVWSVKGLSGISNLTWHHDEFVCSSDGHIVVISKFDKNKIYIMSWRDGKLLGNVTLPREKGMEESTGSTLYNLSVTNSGRIWIYKNTMPYCRIMAIDGTHVAIGKLYIPGLKDDNYAHYWRFSPNEGLMAVKKNKSETYFFTLQVHDEKVVVTKSFSHKDVTIFKLSEGGLEINKNGDLCRLSGEIIAPENQAREMLPGCENTAIEFEKQDNNIPNPGCRLLNLNNGRFRNINSSKVCVNVLCGSSDGKYILTDEANNLKYPDIILYFLNQCSIFHDFLLIQQNKYQLTLYKKSKMIAVLPLEDSIPDYCYSYDGEHTFSKIDYIDFFDDFAVSPNGANIGFEGYTKDDKKFYGILGR